MVECLGEALADDANDSEPEDAEGSSSSSMSSGTDSCDGEEGPTNEAIMEPVMDSERAAFKSSSILSPSDICTRRSRFTGEELNEEDVLADEGEEEPSSSANS